MTYGWLLVGFTAAVSALMTFAVYPAPSAGALLTVMASLPLFLLGLAKGPFFAIAAGAAAFAALVPSLGLDAGAYYLVVNALPACLLIWQAERSNSDASRLAMTAIGYACVPVVFAALFFSTREGGLRGLILERLAEIRDALLANPVLGTQQQMDPTQVEALISAIAALFPAMAAASWVVLVAINAALAQGVLRRFNKASLPTPDIASLRLPRWTAFVLAGALMTAYLPGEIGYLAMNLVPVILLAFLFAGLGVVHALVRRLAGGAMWLAALYVVLFVFGWPGAIVVLVGMLDVIFDFRRRAGPPPADDD